MGLFCLLDGFYYNFVNHHSWFLHDLVPFVAIAFKNLEFIDAFGSWLIDDIINGDLEEFLSSNKFLQF